MESQSNAHATHGFEHPEERFEFARFCLLTQYSRNDDFTGELEGLASKYLVVLDAAGSRAFAGGIEQLADYRLAWGMLSFLAKEPRPGGIAHSLKKLIDGYRGELRALVDRWRMDANWASASLHQAFLARRSAEGSTRSSSGGWSPDRRFLWDLDRQGSLPYDTLLTLPALLVRSDAPGRRVDLRLLTEGSERVYYDPRMDSWDDSLARVRELLGKKRLSSAQSQELLERRAEIEAAFASGRFGGPFLQECILSSGSRAGFPAGNRLVCRG